MSTEPFEPLVQEVARRTGTRLSRQQRDRLHHELRRRLETTTPERYLAHLQSIAGAHELAELLAVVSVHKTDLFRDEGQLEALRTSVLEPLARRGRPISIWSAGCSTGEEVATLLMLLTEVGAAPGSTVLGTDLSQAALTQARRFTYDEHDLRRVPDALRQRYFRGTTLSPVLTSRATLMHHNLMDRPFPFAPSGARFDLIVCRNVLIYFTTEAVQETVAAFAERLEPGGHLVLSTAEPLLEPIADLHTVKVPGAFFYAKIPSPTGERVRERESRSVAVPSIKAVEPQVAQNPEEEGQRLYELVLEWAAEGDHPETESGLRKALYLAPRLAGARYLLGLLLERKQLVADAANEYRRALTLLESDEAMPGTFFVNNSRLAEACRIALKRLRS